MREIFLTWLVSMGILLYVDDAHADSVIMGGASHHTSNGYKDGAELKPWNENNPLIAVEHKNFFVGEMINSYHEETTFFGYHHSARVLGVMVMASNKYKLSPLPRVGSLAVGGFLTAKVGPLLLLAVPGNVYVVTIQLNI